MEQLLYYAFVGWCGTPHGGKIPIPKKGPTDPEPWKIILMGILGGLAGGYLANIGLNGDIVSSSFGALAGGRVVSDIVSRVL
jgi:hypothetical protein